MRAPASFSLRPLGLALLLFFVFTGCRTYGDEYDNTEKMYAQLDAANRLVAENLERARADMNLLGQAAQDDAMLDEYAAQWNRLLLFHEAVLEENLDLAADVDDDDYRAVHRLYGSIITEGRLLSNQYQAILRSIAQVGDSTVAAPQAMYTEGEYWIAPTYYERVQSAQERITMRQALASAADLRASDESVIRALEDVSDE